MIVVSWLFSKKHYEIKIVLTTLAVLLILPIVSVTVLAGSGFAFVGSVFASPDPQTKSVSIYDPNGNKVNELELSTVWPARGYVSEEFGAWEQWRKDLGLGPHTGIDIANEYGQSGGKITPFMPGRVIKVGYDSTCGNYVRISHAYNIQSLYCHMLTPLAIEQTDVKPGDVIGLVGSTGVSSGPHCHFQIEVYGIAVNPRNFMIGNPERNTRAILP